MTPKILYNNNILQLPNCIEGIAVEERNGLCEIEIIYPLFAENWIYLERGNIIVADLNDKVKEQQFRIYKISKPLSGKIKVFARHISYDLARDFIEGLDITNQSCEYCLNQIFRNSKFSKDFIGFSDIVNAQDFKINATNVLSAISGKEGSILDTFGTGAEILRDNKNVHVLNKRGHDNNVVIEYGKNLIGLDATEDESGLITRIRAVARYKDGEEEKEIYTYVDSIKVNDYETPFISEIDFSDKFEKETPSLAKLRLLAEKHFNTTKCDIIKVNYKVDFISLSKCVGFENLKDEINLCDIVTIKDSRYNLNIKTKVIKTTYNFLADRFEKIELGNPKSTLSNFLGNNNTNVTNITNNNNNNNNNDFVFPDTLPDIPQLKANVIGFSTIDLTWTYENKPNYTYELYASRTKNFNPTSLDLIFAGDSSVFQFVAKPNETWHFKVRAVNTYGKATAFSVEKEAKTVKIEDLSNYVNELAIGDALIGTLSLDRGWVGRLNASVLDVKGNLSVTDGNGKRTLDIDSFGNVNLDVATLNIRGKNVATSLEENTTAIQEVSQKVTPDAIINTVSSTIDNKIDNIKVGGSNLLKDAYLDKYTSAYRIENVYFGKRKPKTGDEVTVQIKGYLSNDRVAFGVYNSGGMQVVCRLTRDSVRNGIFTGTATWKEYGENNRVEIYGLNEAGGQCYIEWVKLEFGKTPTDYCDYVDVKEMVTEKRFSEFKQESDRFQFKLEGTNTFNMIENSRPKGNIAEWDYTKDGGSQCFLTPAEWREDAENWNGEYFRSGVWFTGILGSYGGWCHLMNTSLQKKSFDMKKKYTIIFPYHTDNDCTLSVSISDMDSTYHVYGSGEFFSQNGYKWFKATFTPENKGNEPVINIIYRSAGYQIRTYIPWINVYEGEMEVMHHIESTRGSYSAITTLNDNGIRTDFEDGTYASMGRNGLRYYKNGMDKPYQYITFTTKTEQLRNGYWTWIQLPEFFRGKHIDSDFRVVVTVDDIDCNAYVTSGYYNGALRNFKAEVGYWESSNCRLQVRCCIQKIGLTTGKIYGWDDASTDSGAVAGESAARVMIHAQM